jgi:hypothetical protein
MNETGPRYWIGVVSRQHVLRGVAGGFAQIGHGKAAPLRRMAVGDWLIYYSPVETLDDAVPCRRFTAIGRVRGAEVYQVDIGGGFLPFRRDVEYRPSTEAPIAPLIETLDFIPDKKRWGFPFRRGILAIGAADFARIAAAMHVETD